MWKTRGTRGSVKLGVLVLVAALSCGLPTERPPDIPSTDAGKAAAVDAMYEEYRKDFSGVPEMSAAELEEQLALGDVVIVDVREPEEIAVSTIPGSLTKTEFENRLSDMESRTIVVHCTIGYRSAKYVEELKRKGVKAYNLKGSILAWVHEGLPVLDPWGNETKKVHVYGPKWNLLPEGYEGVW